MKVYLAGKITGTTWRHALLNPETTGGKRCAAIGDIPVTSKNEPLALDIPGHEPEVWDSLNSAPRQFPVWPAALRHGHDYTGPYFLDIYSGHGYLSEASTHGLLTDEDSFVPATARYAYLTADVLRRWPLLEKRQRLVRDLCLDAIDRSDVLFAYIDRPDAYGTFAELGYAKGKGKRIWIGTSSESEPELWFIRSLADYLSTEGDPVKAFDQCQIDLIEQLRSIPYTDYLKSEHWQTVRRLALEAAGNRCQLCNYPNNLQVHHKTYERRGCEQPEDVIVLCRHCHAKFHNKLPGG